MPFFTFYEFFPKIAINETRSITLLAPQHGLPPGEYAFIELYCADPDCDCRRVTFSVLNKGRKAPIATISWGWEPLEFYAKWMRGDPDPEDIDDCKGHSLNPNCRAERTVVRRAGIVPRCSAQGCCLRRADQGALPAGSRARRRWIRTARSRFPDRCGREEATRKDEEGQKSPTSRPQEEPTMTSHFFYAARHESDAIPLSGILFIALLALLSLQLRAPRRGPAPALPSPSPLRPTVGLPRRGDAPPPKTIQRGLQRVSPRCPVANTALIGAGS